MSHCDYFKSPRLFKKGELIFNLGNEICNKSNPSRIQIDENKFILPPHPLFHSCDPNAYVDWAKLQLRALKDIKKGEIISYHYGTSEDDYKVGEFKCECGSKDCLIFFKGFKHMNETQRNKIKQFISPFLKKKYY